ncbi:MAG TPA: hypothetical protein PKC59_02145 [Burkholderiaceae bacterium]|nr:hypothetical protein [Burkholderiaceae bacterium]HMY99055.1 hypothetical protein [Burkholderiaceae bacterium]HNB46645.1 hypothetical protein [Burkholderiaceae bacterium]HNG82284.1 hypothetical protein [Burkholderiaceae bacterium]
MGEIVLVDTSVLMNVLDVRGFNQNREPVLVEFERLIEQGAHLFLPMAAVLEAGNHIAQLADGRVRRSTAELFAERIRQALDGEAPWRPMQFPESETMATWLDEFPDAAMKGLGIGDLSIQKDWEALCERHPLSPVRVWTLDSDLAGLDRRPGRRR